MAKSDSDQPGVYFVGLFIALVPQNMPELRVPCAERGMPCDKAAFAAVCDANTHEPDPALCQTHFWALMLRMGQKASELYTEIERAEADLP